MGGVDSPELKRVVEQKRARRQKLAHAPIPEKIRALIKLQEIAAPILQKRGRNVRPWQVSDPA